MLLIGIKQKTIESSKGVSDLSNVSHVTLNGGCATVEGVVASVNAEESDTHANANNAGMHEEGGDSRTGANGAAVSESWGPGPTLSGTETGSVQAFNGVQNFSSINELKDYWHIIHTSKDVVITNEDGTQNNVHPVPGPSPGDKRYQQGLETWAGFKGIGIQVDTYGSKKVNFYNSKGVVATMKYDDFVKLGNN